MTNDEHEHDYERAISMPTTLAYLNGRFLPFDELKISPHDAGFVQGVTVAEQLRTFNGELFRLDQHLARLGRSLATIGVDPGHSLERLGEIGRHLVEHNRPLLAEGDDVGLSIFVTPGPYGTFAPAGASGPTVALHTYPVAFAGFADKYAAGERLAISDVRQVPDNCWPADLKCRSRMHYFLADRDARTRYPGARALLLDQDGWVCEASTANVFLYRADEGFVSPPGEAILPGITVAACSELAGKLGLAWRERQIAPPEVKGADEVFLCSTSPCVLPVVQIDDTPIGGGKPGPIYQQLLAAFSQLVGLDIAAQARKFAART